MKVVIDVRTREEFVKEHVKGAINVPWQDLDFYIDFLKDNEIMLYCDTGFRANIAKEKLAKYGIEATIIQPEKLKEMEKEGRNIVVAINYVFVRDGYENKFEEMVKQLCHETDRMPGFLGSKFFKIDGISAIGSMLPGDLRNASIKPTKYILLTYWESKEAHERSHMTEIFKKAFEAMPAYLAQMPYEEFYEVLK